MLHSTEQSSLNGTDHEDIHEVKPAEVDENLSVRCRANGKRSKKPACDICGKTFAFKEYIPVHMKFSSRREALRMRRMQEAVCPVQLAESTSSPPHHGTAIQLRTYANMYATKAAACRSTSGLILVRGHTPATSAKRDLQPQVR